MSTSYTPILGLALPADGELDGTWGDMVNNSITTLVEEAIAGLAAISSWTGASHTLTTSDGSTSESRCAILECSGAPGGAATVICPTASKLYILKNGVTGGYAVTLKTLAGTGISVPNGKVMWLYCDGTNVVDATTHLSSLTLASALPVGSGGTGATTLTGLVKGNGTSAMTAAVAGTDYLAPAAIGVTVQAYDADLTTWAGKTAPTGDVVGTSDSQTLTNKTLTSPTINTPTVAGATFNDGYTEEVYAVSGTTPALSPTNGSIQTWTLTGSSTPTAGTWAAGQSILMMVADGTSAYTVNWTSLPVTWVGGSEPSLPTSGYAVITLWKVGTTIYGSYAGDVA